MQAVPAAGVAFSHLHNQQLKLFNPKSLPNEKINFIVADSHDDFVQHQRLHNGRSTSAS